MDEQRQDIQLGPTYNSSVPIQDVALKTYRKQWTIEKGGGRGSGRSELMARHDDDGDDDDDVFRTSIDLRKNGFILKKQEAVETITDADHADDLALLANTPTQAEFLLHSLEQSAGDVGLHVNTNKTEYMSFKRSIHLPPLLCLTY